MTNRADPDTGHDILEDSGIRLGLLTHSGEDPEDSQIGTRLLTD